MLQVYLELFQVLRKHLNQGKFMPYFLNTNRKVLGKNFTQLV